MPRLSLETSVHLTWARRALTEMGVLDRDAAVLQGRTVTAWVHLPMRSEARGTAVDRAAARRRRTYRTYLGWTGAETCGSIAERVVDASLDSLVGSHIWKDPARRGQVAQLDGVPVPGGPLDHAGHWAIFADAPTGGFVPFVVEVKLRKGTRGDSRQLMVRSAEKWKQAAPVCADYLDLRDEQLPPRRPPQPLSTVLRGADRRGFRHLSV